MPNKKLTIEESIAQLNEEIDDSEWLFELFVEYAEFEGEEYKNKVFGNTLEKDTLPSKSIKEEINDKSETKKPSKK